MARYPILAAFQDFRGKKASTLVCPRCDFTRQATEEEIGLSDGLPPCSECCDPQATDVREWSFLMWKYEPGDRCRSCGKLDFSMPDGLSGCCSRKCMLQIEYATSLRRGY